MANILQLIKVLPVLLILCGTSVLAQNVSGDPVAAKFICNNTEYLTKLKGISTEQEIRAVINAAIVSEQCILLDQRYVFRLKSKVGEFYSHKNYTQIWQTRENAFILLIEENGQI